MHELYFQIFDAATNKWKLIDEKQHTDVYEKIIEHPVEDDLLYRRNITDETNIINNTERNLLEENLREKHIKTTDSVDYIRSDHLLDESVSSSDLVNQVVVTEDVRTKKVKTCALKLKSRNENILILLQSRTDKYYQSDTKAHKEQCICEMCTCG
jgi:hypothetical protein